MVETKNFWNSKTMISNLLVIVVIGLQIATQKQMFDPEVQALLIAALNLVLRLKTTMPISQGE